MLRWQGEPKHTKFKTERGATSQAGLGRPWHPIRVCSFLKTYCLHSKEEVLKKRLLSIPRKPQWQRRNEHILQTQQPADSGTAFRGAPAETESHLKQKDTFVLCHLSLSTVTAVCRDLDQNANLTFLLAMFNTSTQSCPVFTRLNFLLCTASLHDGVPTRVHSPGGSQTDGSHFESHLVLQWFHLSQTTCDLK